MKILRSYIATINHNIFLINLNKISLSPFDNKRHILDIGSERLANAHYTLRNDHLHQADYEIIELLVNL